MGNVINGGLPNVISQTQKIMLVDANGNSINSFGLGSGVTSVNGLTGALTLAGGSGVTIGTAGSTLTVNGGAAVTNVNGIFNNTINIAGISGISVSTAGSTITISGLPGGGAGTVTGPGSSTNTAIVRWNGTGGTVIQDSSVLIDSNNSIKSSTASVTTLGSVALGLSNYVSGNYAQAFGGGTQALGLYSHAQNETTKAFGEGASSQGLNTVASGNFSFAAGGGALALHNYAIVLSDEFGASSTQIDQLTLSYANGVSLTPRTNITGVSPGTNNLGGLTDPFSGVYANQFATTRISGVVSASPTTIDWNLGASQALGFKNGNITGVIINMTNGIAGSSYTLEMYNNGSGTASPTFSAVKWQNGVSGVPTNTAVAADIFTFYYNGTSFLGNASYNFV